MNPHATVMVVPRLVCDGTRMHSTIGSHRSRGRWELLALEGHPHHTSPVWPGGHIERGESPIDAAVRECFEETGLIVHPLAELYRGRTRDDRPNQICVAILGQWRGGVERASPEGRPVWAPLHAFHNGRFVQFNRRVLFALKPWLDTTAC